MKHSVYIHMNEQLHPRQRNIDKLIEQTRPKNSLFGRFSRLPKSAKVAILTVLVVALSSTTLTVASDNSAEFRDMLYSISPKVGALFSPVMMSDVSQGIQMTVEAVYINGDDAEFIISLKDLEDDRISKSAGLNDSYHIVRPIYFDMSSYGCAGLGYDPETQKRRYHIFTHEPNAGKFWGDTLSFSVSEIMYGMNFVREKVPVPIDLTQVDYNPKTVSGAFLQEKGHGSGGTGAMYFDEYSAEYLVPQSPQDFIDEIKLTGIGWKNGYLHIQNCIENWNGNSHIGYYLVAENGDTLDCFQVNWKENGIEYFETFFEVKPEELKHYQVYAEYVTGGAILKGNWEVKFPLKNMES